MPLQGFIIFYQVKLDNQNQDSIELILETEVVKKKKKKLSKSLPTSEKYILFPNK